MAAENRDADDDLDGEPPRGKPRFRFDREQMRQRAQQARQKTEFILSRAYGLFRDPKLEWEQIKAEETNIPSILLGYTAPLTAFFSICVLIGSFLFESPPIDRAIVGAIVTFLVMTALVALMGYIINLIAENFDADRGDLAAQKVAAYSMTPFFLSGVFWLWPPLIWLTFVAVGLSAFLLYRGLPPLMKTPPERALSYAATVCVAELIGCVVAFVFAGCITGYGSL